MRQILIPCQQKGMCKVWDTFRDASDDIVNGYRWAIYDAADCNRLLISDYGASYPNESAYVDTYTISSAYIDYDKKVVYVYAREEKS